MDEDSKALLKRDVFVQGLLLEWQKKVFEFYRVYKLWKMSGEKVKTV